MGHRRYVWLVSAVLAAGSPAFAFTGLTGMPRFSLTGEITTIPTLEQPGVLRIIARGWYTKSQTGLVEIRLPSSLTATKGDLVRRVHPDGDSPDSEWDIEILPSQTGSFEISGTLTIDVGGNYGRDETDFQTQLFLGPDTSWVTHGRGVRYERVTGTQRYRYGGAYLVPISQSEQVTPDDIVQPAKAVQNAPATCEGCDVDVAGTNVNVLVFLDENGRLTDARPLPKELPSGAVSLPDSATFAAAKASLRSWVFSPSRTKSRPVADFIFVSVEVRKKK